MTKTIIRKKVDLSQPPSKIVRDMRDELLKMKKATLDVELYDWMLGLYDFVLSKPDPDYWAIRYMDEAGDARQVSSSRAECLMLVAKKIGYTAHFPGDKNG